MNKGLCNWRNKQSSLLNGKWLKCMVYKAEVPTELFCYGIVESDFRFRYSNHTMSFRHFCHICDTELSRYLWQLLNSNIRFDLYWSKQTNMFHCKNIGLIDIICISQKSQLFSRSDPKLLLNKRTELISKCRHRNKHLLSSIK